MKKLNIMLVAGLGSLLFIGCTSNQPSFDPSNKEIKTVDGKHYKIPVGARPDIQPLTDKKVIEFYHKIGLPTCEKGDLKWEERKTSDAINKIMRSGSDAGGEELYRKAAVEGKVGCVSPLSDEEYKSYLKK